jgi:hypothetical protein
MIHDEKLGYVDPELHTNDKDKVTNYGLKGHATDVFTITSEMLADNFQHVKKDGGRDLLGGRATN